MILPDHHAGWMAAFHAGLAVRINNRNDLPEGLPERRFLERIGVWSTLMLPLSDGDRLIGVLGFDSQTPDRIWSDEEVEPSGHCRARGVVGPGAGRGGGGRSRNSPAILRRRCTRCRTW